MYCMELWHPVAKSNFENIIYSLFSVGSGLDVQGEWKEAE